MYHFLSGYTAKVAGTERGLGKEPQATFSACFGGPFLPRPAATYASLLGEKLRRHGAQVLAGEYRLGRRTVRRRRAHEAALHPRHAQRGAQRLAEGCGGRAPPRLWRRRCRKPVPACRPLSWMRAACGPTKSAYDRAALDLAGRFNKNFAKFSGVRQGDRGGRARDVSIRSHARVPPISRSSLCWPPALPRWRRSWTPNRPPCWRRHAKQPCATRPRCPISSALRWSAGPQDPQGNGRWRPLDTLTVKLSYSDHKEDYKLMLINGKPTVAGLPVRGRGAEHRRIRHAPRLGLRSAFAGGIPLEGLDHSPQASRRQVFVSHRTRAFEFSRSSTAPYPPVRMPSSCPTTARSSSTMKRTWCCA